MISHETRTEYEKAIHYYGLMLKSTMKCSDGRYVKGLLWKTEQFDFLGSYGMVLSQIKQFYRKLEKLRMQEQFLKMLDKNYSSGFLVRIILTNQRSRREPKTLSTCQYYP